MSVLAGPVALLVLLKNFRTDIRSLTLSVWEWAVPFIPFAFVWEFVQFWHNVTLAEPAPLSRIFWGAVIYAGARHLGVTRKQLAYAACIGACVYFAIAMDEFFIQGRERVWGGVYENRFGQFSVWLAGLCFLHFLYREREKADSYLTYFLPLGSFFALVTAVMTGSRGALAAIPVLFFIAPMAGRRNRKLAFIATICLFLIGFTVFLYPPVTTRFFLAFQEFIQYFKESVFSETSIGVRLETWRIAFGILGSHPLLGMGFTSFANLQASHEVSFNIPGAVLLLPDFHSDWGKIIVLGGACLFMSFCISIFLLFKRAASDVYRYWFLLGALIFSFAELFFCNKLGFSFFVSTWALYSASSDNEKYGLLSSGINKFC
ncbi:MAG: O-antigen ligase family protein [Formivibrio sp.]|nr:O-antigen ligase family protein [Formivibrio sp.]